MYIKDQKYFSKDKSIFVIFNLVFFLITKCDVRNGNDRSNIWNSTTQFNLSESQLYTHVCVPLSTCMYFRTLWIALKTFTYGADRRYQLNKVQDYRVLNTPTLGNCLQKIIRFLSVSFFGIFILIFKINPCSSVFLMAG